MNLLSRLTLNQERNGFEHAAAKTAQQQRELYKEIFPLVTNALICFFKKHTRGKYKFEVVSKSQDKEFEITDFNNVETKLKSLII